MASEPSPPGGLEFEPQQRLHPLSWLFALTSSIKQFIFPLAAFLILGARNDAEIWGLIIVVPLVIGALWNQWIYRYGFGPRGLVIRDGLFFRNVRQIEYPRIENVDVERGVLHRLLGVAQVSIATSTGGKAEASIRVLSLEAVQELRDRIFSNRGEATETRQAGHIVDDVLLHLPPVELIRYGLIDNRGMLIVAALFGFLYQAGSFELMQRNAATWLDAPLHDFAALGLAMQAAFIVSAFATFLVALRALSIVLALVTLFDFTLTRIGQDFRIRHGLLTRLALTLRVRRIQSVHQTQTLLHRLFKRVSLRADLAGDSGTSEDGKRQSQVRTRWLAPICTHEKAHELFAAALPDVDFRYEPDWQPLAPRARARMFRRSAYVAVLIASVAALILHLLPQAPFEPGVILIPAVLVTVLPLAWLNAHLYVANTRWALTPDAILLRYGWLTKRLIVAPRNRLQSVQLGSTPFDRRHRMASVSIDTAGAGALRDNIRIPLLSQDVAHSLWRALYESRTSADPPRV